MDAASVLNPEHLQTIFLECLFKDDEDKSNYVKAEGINSTYGFHPERLESHRQDVAEMLAELPDEFKASAGGGWSFLNACMDRHGNQWTGLHQIMEQLFVLGIALGLVEYQLPRELWSSLPGGMPYIVVK